MSFAVNNVPRDYKKGYTIFCDLKFYVNKDVLIPRIETEKLVSITIDFINKNPKYKNVIDVGTGSGCIAVALAAKLPDVAITAIDLSSKALAVAKKNAKTHNVANKITFLKSNLVCSLAEDVSFNIIVCNLPYIPTSRITELDASVKDFEPILALDGGVDGFDVYRKLFSQVHKKNIKFNLLLAEIDETQNDLAIMAAKKYFPFKKCDVTNDKYGYPRFLIVH